jgi:hypothetical protein
MKLGSLLYERHWFLTYHEPRAGSNGKTVFSEAVSRTLHTQLQRTSCDQLNYTSYICSRLPPRLSYTSRLRTRLCVQFTQFQRRDHPSLMQPAPNDESIIIKQGRKVSDTGSACANTRRVSVVSGVVDRRYEVRDIIFHNHSEQRLSCHLRIGTVSKSVKKLQWGQTHSPCTCHCSYDSS